MRWARRAGLLPLAFITFVSLGLPDGTLGVAWPSMRESFDQPVSALGLLVVVFTGGYLLATVAAGALSARLGTGLLLATATASAAGGAIVFAASPAWWGVVAGSALLGFGGGAIDAGLNAHVALGHGVRAMSLLHASYGVGATGGPVLATVAVEAAGTWRMAYVGLGALSASLAGCFIATAGRWHVAPATDDEREVETSPSRPRRGRALLLTSLLLFLLYTGVEVSAGQWSYSLLVEDRRMGGPAAAGWVASYWAAFTAGRFAAAALGHRLSAGTLLRTSVFGALLGSLLLWWDPGSAGVAGLPLLGVGLAAVFPTLVTLTPARLGRDRARHNIGYQLAAAGLGGAVGPAAVGVLTAQAGIDVLCPALVAGAGAVVLLDLVAARLAASAAA